MSRISLPGILLLTTLLLAGCATTSFKETWKAPAFTGKVHQVYLIGVAHNDKLRRIFEDEFARQLAARGVTGIPSYPDLQISGSVDREALRARLRAKGTDAVLVARITGREQRTSLQSGAAGGYATGGPDGYYDQFGLYNPLYAYRYYDQHYNGSLMVVTMNPIIEHEFQVVTTSANLYDTESAEVVWSALTETPVSDETREQRIREFAASVAERLQADGLL